MGKVNLALNAKRITFIAGDYRSECSPMATQSRALNPLATLHCANSGSILATNAPKREPAQQPCGDIAPTIPACAFGIPSAALRRNKGTECAFKRSLPDATFRRRLADRYPPGAMPNATNPYISRRLPGIPAQNNRCITHRSLV